MKTNKKLIWRLDGKPTVDDLDKAVRAGIIDVDEAKSMLVREEDEKNIDKDELKEIKEEIKFLRKIILEFSKKEPTIIYKNIYDWFYEKPYRPYRWHDEWISLTCNTAKSEGDITVYNAMSSIMEKK